MATRTPIVGGNWKCNAGKGITGADVDTLVTGLNALAAPSCEVYVAPPAIYLERVQASVSSDFNVSSQNVWKETSGAYTGETSAEMLMDMGVSYTLIGHSERRDIFGETDDMLGAKIAHAQSVGMTVVACIGEHQEDREAGTTMGAPSPAAPTPTLPLDLSRAGFFVGSQMCSSPSCRRSWTTRATVRPPPPSRPFAPSPPPPPPLPLN